jgi:hypothetical protein
MKKSDNFFVPKFTIQSRGSRETVAVGHTTHSGHGSAYAGV